jgi:predicted amidohydrolase
MITRAAENTCYFASVNYASPGSTTTSAIITPNGAVLAWQPYGVEGLLLADLDLTTATGLYAHRYKPIP